MNRRKANEQVIAELKKQAAASFGTGEELDEFGYPCGNSFTSDRHKCYTDPKTGARLKKPITRSIYDKIMKSGGKAAQTLYKDREERIRSSRRDGAKGWKKDKQPPQTTIAERIKARSEQMAREKYNIPAEISVKDFLDQLRKPSSPKSARKKTWDEINPKDYSSKSDYYSAQIEALKSSALVTQFEKQKLSIGDVEKVLKAQRLRADKLSARSMDQMSGNARRSTSKATAGYGAQLAYRDIDTYEKYLEARRGLDRSQQLAAKPERDAPTPTAKRYGVGI